MSGEDKYRLFLGGDEDAFEGIMREYFDGLIFFINRYVNDPHAAEKLHENISAEEESPESVFLKSEQARILNAALLKLPPDMRAAVHLVYFEGLSYKETAGILKKSAKQVDNLLCRAKAAMRKELEKEDIP